VLQQCPAAAARQSVKVGTRDPHPIRKNTGAIGSTNGQLFGKKVATSAPNRKSSTAQNAQ
jgi:hypothetical protein